MPQPQYAAVARRQGLSCQTHARVVRRLRRGIREQRVMGVHGLKADRFRTGAVDRHDGRGTDHLSAMENDGSATHQRRVHQRASECRKFLSGHFVRLHSGLVEFQID